MEQDPEHGGKYRKTPFAHRWLAMLGAFVGPGVDLSHVILCLGCFSD
jgi:hypothetical protein